MKKFKDLRSEYKEAIIKVYDDGKIVAWNPASDEFLDKFDNREIEPVITIEPDTIIVNLTN